MLRYVKDRPGPQSDSLQLKANMAGLPQYTNLFLTDRSCTAAQESSSERDLDYLQD